MIIKNHKIVLKDTSPGEMARFRQFFLDIWRQQIEDDKNAAEMEKFITERYENTVQPDKKYTTTWLGEVILKSDIRESKNKNNPKENIFESFTENNVNTLENQSFDLFLNGHFYTKEGKYLGKINAGDNVYITDEIAFSEIEKVKTVLKDIISYSANRYKLDNSPFILEIEKRKNEIIYFTEKYKLTNTQLLDRANWIYAEGGYKIPEFVAYTIENAYNDNTIGKKDENWLYHQLMKDQSGRLEKDKYLSGGYENQTGKRFWKVRGTILMDQDMMNTIAAVIKSKLYPEKDPTEGTNSWLGYREGFHEGKYFIKTLGRRFFFNKAKVGEKPKVTSKEKKYITID